MNRIPSSTSNEHRGSASYEKSSSNNSGTNAEDLEANVQNCFEDWREKISNLSERLNQFNESMNQAVNSQGKGYEILTQVEAWLDSLYEDAGQKHSLVQGILQEAQKALTS